MTPRQMPDDKQTELKEQTVLWITNAIDVIADIGLDCTNELGFTISEEGRQLLQESFAPPDVNIALALDQEFAVPRAIGAVLFKLLKTFRDKPHDMLKALDQAEKELEDCGIPEHDPENN